MVPSQMPPLRQPAPLNQPSLLPSRTGIHQPHPQSHAPHVPSETIINGGNQAFKNAGPYAPGGGQAVVDTSQLDPDVHQQNGFQFKPAPSRYAFLRQDPPRVPPLHFNANGAIPYPHLHHPSPSLNRPPTRNPQLFHAQSGSTHGPVPMDASSGAGLLPRQEGGTRGTFWQEDPDARRAVAFWKAKKTIDRLVGRPTFADNTPVTRPTGVNNTTVARPSRAYNTPVARPPVHLKCRTPFGGCNPPFVGCSKNYRVTVDLTSDPEEDVKITVGAKGSTGVKRENIFGYEDVCAKRQRVPLQPTTTNNKFYRETVDLTSDADEDVKTMVGAKSSTGASGRGSITHQAFMSVRR
ncbi:hypothetical protein EJ06DRAFT_531308 [Trichodelitschia bisporula]|uniref:Uncharacterized protein n=1 Tax=Trichodelitschia bisporula TaxID=703511 RepID=A0A6G1HSG2_9PEZI|nr:hypothetical protein EJ06DRAFT_531308 [Trichodelitschia bisporula]